MIKIRLGWTIPKIIGRTKTQKARGVIIPPLILTENVHMHFPSSILSFLGLFKYESEHGVGSFVLGKTKKWKYPLPYGEGKMHMIIPPF